MLQRNSFKLALAQMLVEGGRKEENLRRAIERIREAAASGAQVVVLPEAMPLGWTHSSTKRDADAIPEGDCCLRLREAARANRIYVCAGLVERAGPLIFNSAALIGPDGDVLLRHRNDQGELIGTSRVRSAFKVNGALNQGGGRFQTEVFDLEGKMIDSFQGTAQATRIEVAPLN